MSGPIASRKVGDKIEFTTTAGREVKAEVIGYFMGGYIVRLAKPIGKTEKMRIRLDYEYVPPVDPDPPEWETNTY